MKFHRNFRSENPKSRSKNGVLAAAHFSRQSLNFPDRPWERDIGFILFLHASWCNLWRIWRAFGFTWLARGSGKIFPSLSLYRDLIPARGLDCERQTRSIFTKLHHPSSTHNPSFPKTSASHTKGALLLWTLAQLGWENGGREWTQKHWDTIMHFLVLFFFASLS